MRFLILFDALDRIIASLLPLDSILLTRELPFILAFDMLGNYTLDFFPGLAVLVFELSMIFSINNIVHRQERDTSILLGLFVTAMTTLVFVCIAVLYGTVIMKYMECEILRKQDI